MTHTQRPNFNQLNIFQCTAWNSSSTTHGLNHIDETTIPYPQKDNKDPKLSIPTPHVPPAPHTHAFRQSDLDIPHITPLPLLFPTKPTITHQSPKTFTVDTRGMHTTIIDLQNILTTQPDPHIIALTETKHRHIKSIWRQTLRNYKLVHNPSFYNKHAKRC